jgi:hypothetical protein
VTRSGRESTWLRHACIAAVFLASCGVAWANGCSVYILSGLCHLSLGNAVIALAEAALLLWWVRAPFRLGFLPMIGANYASWLVGTVSLIPVGLYGTVATAADPIGRIVWIAVLGYVLLFALTVLVEWPFYHRVLREVRPEAARRDSLRLCLACNAVTCVLILLIYLPGIDLSALRNVRWTQSVVTDTPDDALVYYVGRDGLLWSARVNGTGATPVAGPVFTRAPWPSHAYPEAFFELERRPDGSVDLCLRETGVPLGSGAARIIVPGVSARLPYETERRYAEADDDRVSCWTETGLSWVPRKELLWEAFVCRDQTQALHLTRRSADRPAEFFVGLHLPPVAAPRSNDPWYLPDGRIVFQFGPYIALLDPETREIGIIAKGSDPVVIPDDAAP